MEELDDEADYEHFKPHHKTFLPRMMVEHNKLQLSIKVMLL